MKVSTRGRYALRVLIDLAEHQSDEYIPMKSIAERQNISLKYLEQILPVLKKNELIYGVHGKGGGYRLARTPDKITAADVLNLTESGLAPVVCLEFGGDGCQFKDSCRTLLMWKGLNQVIVDYLSQVTIASMMRGYTDKS